MKPPVVMVRVALPGDAEGLSGLAAQTFLYTWHELVPEADRVAYAATTFTPEAFSLDLVCPSITYLVLETDDGALVGYARLSFGAIPPAPLELPAPAMLDRFYLDSSWHGTGAAQKLLESVFVHARKNTVETLWLCHHPSNRRAGRFYSRQGFIETGVVLPFTLAERVYDDTVLIRPL